MKSFLVYRDKDFDTFEIKEYENRELAARKTIKSQEEFDGEVVLCKGSSIAELLKVFGEYVPRSFKRSGSPKIIKMEDHVSYLWSE